MGRSVLCESESAYQTLAIPEAKTRVFSYVYHSFFDFTCIVKEKHKTMATRDGRASSIHPIANDAVLVRSHCSSHRSHTGIKGSRNKHQHEFCFLDTNSSAYMTIASRVRKRLVARSPLLLTLMILGAGHLIGSFASMMNINRYLSLAKSTYDPTNGLDGRDGRADAPRVVVASSSVKMIRKAGKAELVARFQRLVDESQQDVIVNVFTPVARSHTLNSITCVTQGGLSKLPRLIDLTSRWLGPVSFSTVVTSEHDLDVLFQFWTDNALIQEYVSLHVLMELPQLQRSETGRS